MSDRRYVLVTGGAGYIGSHTCKSLLKNGFIPISFDNLVYGHRWAVKWGKLVEGDLMDRDALNDVFQQYDFISAIHFADYAYVGESVTHPDKYYRNNVVGTLNLIDAMLENNVKTIVFSSTCATYGIPRIVPIQESHSQAPLNPYGYSKLIIERILADYSKAYGLKYGVLRYFNAAGADPEQEIGEDHEPETHLIPLAIKAAFDESFELAVYGDDYDTEDGTAIRDYIHVEDLADATILSLKHLIKDNEPFCINLGTGSGTSVKDVVSNIEAISGKAVKYTIQARRAGDPPILVADPKSAKITIDWTPKYTTIGPILESSIKWYCSHFNSGDKQ